MYSSFWQRVFWQRATALGASAYALCCTAFVSTAAAEKIVAKEGTWEIYTDGRVGGFASYVHGDGLPRSAVDASGNLLHDIGDGGLVALAEREPIGDGSQLSQGTIDSMRVRNGFIANIFGIGVRDQLGETRFTGYFQTWAVIESEQRRKNRPNFADVRQGYVKAEGPWGSLLVGRSRALFSRGATDIDVMYAHRYALGYPGNTDNQGPSSGHIGFGVLGSGFSAGIVYATPVLSGLQLNVGAFDPIQLQGAWTRTRWLRPEAEVTYEQALGSNGKFVLFGNGAYQPLYREDSAESTHAAGAGYGGRFEYGPLRLGLAGHYGVGLGLNYALEASGATIDPANGLRKFDGYYAQSQLVLGKLDVSLGWGTTRVFLNAIDRVPNEQGNIPHSVIKNQTGISAGAVYHLADFFHIAVDGFRAEANWFLGEKQVVYIANAGTTFTW